MRALDRILRHWRIQKAEVWIRSGDRLLDVGCYDEMLLSRVADRVACAVGIDPVAREREVGKLRILEGRFPGEPVFDTGSFDCITALAVLEHVPDAEGFARECARVLGPGGRVVLTVPHPIVDGIIAALIRFRIADGMDFDEHRGFDVRETLPVFLGAGFELLRQRRFQLGLNHLFVFEMPRPSAGAEATSP